MGCSMTLVARPLQGQRWTLCTVCSAWWNLQLSYVRLTSSLMSVRTKLKTQLLQLVLLTRHGLSSCFPGMLFLSFNNLTRHSLTSCLPGLLFVSVRVGKNLRFLKKDLGF